MPIEQEELKQAIKSELENCIGLSGDRLSSARARLKGLYLGDDLGGDKELREAGWSTYQDRSVLETVEWAKPGLLRVFASSDEVVRFEPRRVQDEKAAEEATDYINKVVFGQHAFMSTYNVITDALYQRVGWLKVFYDDSLRSGHDDYLNLSGEEAQALVLQYLMAGGKAEGVQATLDPESGLYSLSVENERRNSDVRVTAVPPERVVFSAGAVDMADCRFVAHWEMRTRAELLSEGYSASLIDSIGDDGAETYPETAVLNLVNSSDADAASGRDGDFREYKVYEAYIMVSSGGRPERRRVVFAGEESNVTILEDERWNMPRPPLFPVSSVPLPHAPVGICIADLVSDIQLLRTELYRKLLDNLSLQNQGEIFINERGKDADVDLDQFLNRSIGGVYFGSGEIEIKELPASPQAGAQAAQVLQMTERIKETRTGIGQNLQGIQADALQGTATGANIFDDNINQRNELIARLLAELLYKPVAEYALALVIKYRRNTLEARLNGRFMSWDPRSWPADMDVRVSVGLGTGNRAKQTSALQGILALQQQFVQNLGENSPVRLTHIMRTVHKLVRSMGFDDPEQFFGSYADAEQAERAVLGKQGPPAQEPDPMQGILQAQFQLEQQKTQAEIALKREKTRAELALAQQKAQAGVIIKQAEMAMQYQLEQERIAAEQELDAVKLAMRNSESLHDGSL